MQKKLTLFILCFFNSIAFGMESDIEMEDNTKTVLDSVGQNKHVYLNGMQQIIHALQEGKAYTKKDVQETCPPLPKNIINLIFKNALHDLEYS